MMDLLIEYKGDERNEGWADKQPMIVDIILKLAKYFKCRMAVKMFNWNSFVSVTKLLWSKFVSII